MKGHDYILCRTCLQVSSSNNHPYKPNGSKLKAQMNYIPIRFQLPITTHTTKMCHNGNADKIANA